MNDAYEIEKQLREREERFLTADIRHSREAVSELLAESFIEFGCSGRVYDKARVIKTLSSEPSPDLSISDFKVRPLAPGVVLVTYLSSRQVGSEDGQIESLRSSIWKNFEGAWQLVFHQGTRLDRASAPVKA